MDLSLGLRLFHELRLQPHGTDAVDPAVDVVIALDETDVLQAALIER